jgi:hypothetical protein
MEGLKRLAKIIEDASATLTMLLFLTLIDPKVHE